MNFLTFPSRQFLYLGVYYSKNIGNFTSTLPRRLIDYLERREYPAGIFCDLSRAFDYVDVSLLLNKLERYGVRGSALEWLSSLLMYRRQFVSVSYIDCASGRSSYIY